MRLLVAPGTSGNKQTLALAPHSLGWTLAAPIASASKPQRQQQSLYQLVTAQIVSIVTVSHLCMARLNEPPIAPSGGAIASSIAPGTESIEACKSPVDSNSQRVWNLLLKNMRTKSKKLPEQPPANLEEVKRRFIRQNRELAKANSTQSLRIRSLEIENTRLLDEILRLRERNLWLERERQDAQANASGEAIRKIKDELQTKFAELTGFVQSLADFKSDVSSEDYLLSKEKLLSPSTRQYRERQPLAELMQDCIMPTISEDNMFPRQTLDAEQIRAIRLSDHSSNGSPDLGPPPIAHFDCGNDSQGDLPAVEPEITSTDTPTIETEDNHLAANVSINLETRRRKREGHSRLEARRHSVVSQSLEQTVKENNTTILRTGAKRKLADRDSEKLIKPPSSDDFTFSRKPMGPGRPDTESEDGQAQSEMEVKKVSNRDVVRPPTQPTRRALSSKSTNISPQKAQSKLAQPEDCSMEKAAPPKLNISRQHAQPRTRRASSVPLFSTVDEPPATIEISQTTGPAADGTVELPPKTPATGDLFSPTMTEDSVNKPLERGDTPPPADLSSISNTTDGGQRPSRRARSAVNYAEPSLILKMRRPGKEMVDAISGIQDPRRTMNAPESRKSQGVTPSSQPTSIKKEPQEVDDIALWRDGQGVQSNPGPDLDPGSPLRSRTTIYSKSFPPSGIPAPEVISVIKSETEEPCPFSSSASAENSGTSTVISTLIATSRKRRESSAVNSIPGVFTQPLGDANEAAKGIEEMNLFDSKESSSPVPEKVEDRKGAGVLSKDSATAKLSSQRRHSSIVKDVPTTVKATSGIGVRRERAASRRRSTLL